MLFVEHNQQDGNDVIFFFIKMETELKKDLLNFCNDAMFYDYKNVEGIGKFNQVRNCIINAFYKTSTYTRILVCLSIIDDIIFKIVNDDIEKILNSINELRENIIYMQLVEKRILFQYLLICLHRQFFRNISHNHDYIQTHCSIKIGYTSGMY